MFHFEIIIDSHAVVGKKIQRDHVYPSLAASKMSLFPFSFTIIWPGVDFFLFMLLRIPWVFGILNLFWKLFSYYLFTKSLLIHSFPPGIPTKGMFAGLHLLFITSCCILDERSFQLCLICC